MLCVRACSFIFIPMSAFRDQTCNHGYLLFNSQPNLWSNWKMEAGRQPDAGCFCLKCPPGIIILALIFNLQLNNQFYVKDSCKQISCMCPTQYILMGGVGVGWEYGAIRTKFVTDPDSVGGYLRSSKFLMQNDFCVFRCSANNLHVLQCGIGEGAAG